eukprot:CAMPEP_0113384154 /NCGR_PEP_ID=MMETSP0013_2-20120614/6740_1 /TAXON_ID=2843 ORGANISM="Skeletonema costatum, Strain 1716" /NCGR_SAMPLE_ID=MMETSP0013_2 /ASSEMBLY_ACC=CAM_ASM_000158 /LENGTH=51 /DNA_ID=CAMNT_0000266741 /DNA_START=39 /DNA_END=191 /DNA_ORIENTATION=+ /assembly_acc=CAM_ASM_000158
MASKEEVLASAKQNNKTIDFWDTFYKDLNTGVNANEEQPSNNNDLEWIVSD